MSMTGTPIGVPVLFRAIEYAGGIAVLFSLRGSFFLALREKVTYHAAGMRLNALLICSLLVIVVAAPIVDAIACDDCTIVLRRDMQQRFTDGVHHSDANILPSDADRSAQQETSAAQDVCPICANTAAAAVNTWCGAPSVISHTNHLPKLIAFSDPSYSIAKPPQN